MLQGPQGAGKSTFFRALTEPWFTDTDIDLSSKDTYLVLGGILVRRVGRSSMR